MDSRQFDRFARFFAATASRRDLGRMSAAGAGIAGFHAAAIPGAAKKKRKKKVTLCHEGQTITVGKRAKNEHLSHGDTLGACPSPPPPLPYACHDILGNYHEIGFKCHGQCCGIDSQCCSPRFDGLEAIACYPLDYRCCESGNLAGACPPHLECCYPSKLGPLSVERGCGGAGAPVHCCRPPFSGGSCAHDESCCPTAQTNEENLGCCPLSQHCCNQPSDCPGAPDATCVAGCCQAT